MKILFFILLISYSTCLTTSYYAYIKNLDQYSSYSYNGTLHGISVLDTSGLGGDKIYISFSIGRSNFITEYLYYDFSDNYPTDLNYEFPKQLEASEGISKTSTSKTPSKRKTYHYQLFFNIPKENKKYLIINNIEYPKYSITIEHHRFNPYLTTIIIVIIIVVVCAIIFALGIYLICKHRKRNRENSFKDSSKINFNKGKPSPLFRSNQNTDLEQDQTYTSSQSNNQIGEYPSQPNNY